jgi:GntR family transcriptional regulator
MKIKVDPKSSIPIYYQIFDQIKHQIAVEELKVGEKIPTIRELAVELEINPNTVAKSYYELQREGILDTIQGVGTYVKNNKQILKPNERERKLTEIINKFLDEAFRYGFSKEDIFKALKD